MSSWIDYYKSEDSVVKRLTGKQGPSKLPSPPGYNEQNYKLVREGRLIADNARLANKNKQKDEELERLKRSKLWEMVIQPTKSIPMNAIMMWMTPNSIQIISIMMTVMLFFNSLKDILSVNKKFENAELESQYDRLVMKGVYVLCCSGNLLVGLWKLNAMGLIPNKSGDWLSWETTLAAVQDVVL